jgi:hypothetical protein
MRTPKMLRWTSGLLMVALLLVNDPSLAQTFSSGSTGALGAFSPTANTTLVLPPDGIFNYTTITIPSGITVTFTPNVANTPVVMLATGDVSISGAINVNGISGASTGSLAARGGPGGFQGGIGGSPPVGGAGPGGGAPGGLGSNATYGAPSSFVSLMPLFGGSGGGGGTASAQTNTGGGGGGGAIVIASSTRITLNGSINANGGSGATSFAGSGFNAGAGSGGAVRLVAPQLAGTGQVVAVWRHRHSRQCAGGTGPGSPRADDQYLQRLDPLQQPPSRRHWVR